MPSLRLPGVLSRCLPSPILVAPWRLPAAPPRRGSQSLYTASSALTQTYRPVRYSSMVRRGADTSPSEPTHKKRRISYSQPAAMSQTEEVQTPQLPELQLTPIESTLKELLLDVAGFIHEQAIANGGSKNAPQTELRFTGGWVRDKLLGVDSHDIDVGISTMTGYQYGLALKEYLDIPENLDKYKKNHPDGELSEAIVSLHKIDANPEKSKHLETVTTKIFGLDIDMVNLRKETYSEDSRNPQMEFGTAQEDAMRRDATINALFYNLNESRVEDLTGLGITDMQNKIIRTPLEPLQTFKDDPLRILRLIRFASRLGYQIHEDTEKAMNNDEIGEALKLKISRERVGTEIHKMLEGPITHLKARVYTHIDTGPDPRGALTMIDRTGLYPTIFANLQDDVHADTTTWPLAYNTLEELLHPAADNSEEFKAIINCVRSALVRDESEAYYAWLIAALAPWIDVPDRTSKTKPNAPRSVEVARDSLRADNKTNGILRGASKNWKSIVSVKSGHIKSDLDGTPAEIRQHIGLHLRTWNKDWRLCLVAAILQEAMQGRDFSTVIQEYDSFLTYIAQNGLTDISEMKPIVDGGEIMKALKAKGGPWTGKAMDLVIKWQLLHPETTDKNQALEEVSNRREELGLPPAS